MAATLSTRSCSELWNDSHCVSTSGLAKRSVRQKCWRKWAQVAAGRFAIVELDTNALESVLPLPIAAGCPASESCPELAQAASRTAAYKPARPRCEAVPTQTDILDPRADTG